MCESASSRDDSWRRKLVLSMIQYLYDDTSTGLVQDRESASIAVQCMEAIYGLDYTRDCHEIEDTDSLLTIFINNYRPEKKLSDKIIAEAEKFKLKGNELVHSKSYREAVGAYTKAIELNPKNAVYYCNRAAAYIHLNNNTGAVQDCEQAVVLDPNYSKAYGRLGLAYNNLLLFANSKAAYEKAVALDPTSVTYKENLKTAQQNIEKAKKNIHTSPHLFEVTTRLLSNAQSSMSGNEECPNIGASSASDMNMLFQVGHALAQHVQTSNPTLVDDLRRHILGGLNEAQALDLTQALGQPSQASETQGRQEAQRQMEEDEEL